jgi:hypothetical protein
MQFLQEEIILGPDLLFNINSYFFLITLTSLFSVFQCLHPTLTVSQYHFLHGLFNGMSGTGYYNPFGLFKGKSGSCCDSIKKAARRRMLVRTALVLLRFVLR